MKEASRIWCTHTHAHTHTHTHTHARTHARTHTHTCNCLSSKIRKCMQNEKFRKINKLLSYLSCFSAMSNISGSWPEVRKSGSICPVQVSRTVSSSCWTENTWRKICRIFVCALETRHYKHFYYIADSRSGNKYYSKNQHIRTVHFSKSACDRFLFIWYLMKNQGVRFLKKVLNSFVKKTKKNSATICSSAIICNAMGVWC